MPDLADITKRLDYVGRTARQRKVRAIDMDYHEDVDSITALLLTGMGYTVKRRKLPMGDYQWDSKLGQVIVERKTPSDIQDLVRFGRQLEGMRIAAHNGCFCVLLIDHAATNKKNRWDDIGFDNLLMAVGGSVKIAHCNQGELANRLDSLYQFSQKGEHGFLERN